MIEAAIRFILSNPVVVLTVIALVTTAMKLRQARMAGVPADTAYTLWGELLFYAIGIGFFWAFLFHAFAQSIAARAIGWAPSPFEWELAWAELGIAVVALISLWRGYDMRAAVTLIFAIFSFGAAAQHIDQIVCCRNYAPGNAGLILWLNDIALPFGLLLLAYGARSKAP